MANDEKKEELKDDTTSIESKITEFAETLALDSGSEFACYVYRIVTDEHGNRTKPFIKKYVSIEPDIEEIADKYRAGKYLCQFIYKKNGKKQSKAFQFEVDQVAFPPVDVRAGSLIPFNPGMSENTQLQLATISAISEAMKAAYSNKDRTAPAGEPLEVFSNMMEVMENSYSRAMAIQNTVMERVLQRNMEKSYGLPFEGQADNAASGPLGLDEGTISKYAPLVREVVDGIKTIVGFFGSVPADVVKRVKGNDRFQTILKDEKAMVVIGSALRKEFGNTKAAELMHTFGVRMVLRKAPEVVKTPDIAAMRQAAAPAVDLSENLSPLPAGRRGGKNGKAIAIATATK